MSRFLASFSIAVLLSSALGACASSLVGGECIEGFSVCRGACVDLQNDRTNCGVCGNTCAAGAFCAAGACVIGEGGVDMSRLDLGFDAGDAAARDGDIVDGDVLDGDALDGELRDLGTTDGSNGDLDGSVDDGSVGDGGDVDGGAVDGGAVDGGAVDGGAVDGGDVDGGDVDGGPPVPCDIGELRCGAVCVRSESDPANCGMCGNACPPAEVCSMGMCAPLCAPPLVPCGRNCVDLQSDPDHCGSCPNVCATGICIDAVCSSGTAGHVVLIGHDFTTTRIGMNRVAGNAVFLGSGAPVRVLAYEGRAARPSITGTDLAINQVATARGRMWMRIPVTRAEVPLMLATAEVLVVYAQRGETDAELQAIGAEWGVAMASFVRRGGVVVVFDTGGSSNVGTFQLLTSAGLLTVASRTVISGATVMVDPAAAGDAVAIGVPAMYRAETTTVRFDTTDPITVVRESLPGGGGGPVVVHRVVVP